MRILGWCVFLLVSVAGCGASGEPFRDVAYNEASEGRIYVYRPSRFTASLAVLRVQVDGTTIGDLYSGGCVYAIVRSGDHTLRLFGVKGTYGDGGTHTFPVRRGATIYIRVLPGTNTWSANPVPAHEAKAEIAKVKLSGGKRIG